MKKIIALLMSAACLAGAQRPTAPLQGPTRGTTIVTRAPQRLNVLFLGDNGHHRPSQRLKDVLPVLTKNGIDVFYTDERGDLNDSELDRYQVVMLYNNHMTVTRPQITALMKFVEDGGGLVVLHCASASFQNSEEFIRLVGAAFKSHGTGTFEPVRVMPNHAVLAGVPAIDAWDETYIHTKHNPVNRTVLEVRRENGHEEPWTWVRSHGRGRVFYTASGHDQRVWGTPGFQHLLGNAIKWTAFGDAPVQLAGTPPMQQVDLEVPLPTYKRPPAPWNTLDTAINKAQAALPTQESLKLMTLRPRFSVRPFAVEPLVGNIIDFTWDARGRMWAVETNDYPNRVLDDSVKGGDRVIILEDANGDGQADRVKTFVDGLNLATSIVFANGGVIVGQAPHMLFFKDTNGDDKADSRQVMFTGFPRGDTHGTISNLRYGFDNMVWGSVGYNGFRGTVGPSTYERGRFGAGYFRFPADGSDLEYVARTSNNTWGLGITEDNFVFGSTANSRPTNFVHIPLRYYRSAGLRDTVLPGIEDRQDIYPVTEDVLQVDQFGRYTAGTAHEIYTARAFPSEYWNRMAFVAEPTGHVIGMFALSDSAAGSGFRAKNRWNFMGSRDAWAAPVQVKVGPDGAVWVSDFYTLVAQHNPTPRNMQGCCQNGPGNAYETPNRDRLHGRIYRISYDSAALGSRPSALGRLDNATPAQLVAALKNDNLFWRLTAQRLLVERKRMDVVPALIRLAEDQSVDALGLNVGALHGLWTLHGLGALASDAGAMRAARNGLSHPAASVRRAALMMLPRDYALLDGIFAAGILPDRKSPWPVDYTVGTTTLQDADPHVRLEALLVIAEIGASPADPARERDAILDVITNPGNARDPWIPDAAAMAGFKLGLEVLSLLVDRPLPADTLAVAGIARAVHKMSRSIAATKNVNQAVAIAAGATEIPAALGLAAANGIAEGWPLDSAGTPVTLTMAQKVALETAAREASPQLNEVYTRIATRWNLPNAFKPE